MQIDKVTLLFIITGIDSLIAILFSFKKFKVNEKHFYSAEQSLSNTGNTALSLQNELIFKEFYFHAWDPHPRGFFWRTQMIYRYTLGRCRLQFVFVVFPFSCNLSVLTNDCWWFWVISIKYYFVQKAIGKLHTNYKLNHINLFLHVPQKKILELFSLIYKKIDKSSTPHPDSFRTWEHSSGQTIITRHKLEPPLTNL